MNRVMLKGMTSIKKIKRSQPSINYQFSENNEAQELLNNAFDILFEETLKKCDSLTIQDN